MRVGFVGIGAMGWPMAANIAKTGVDLMVFDLDEARLARFAAEFGARAAASIGELGSCDIVVTMLPTGAHVKAVLLERDGGAFVAASKPELIVVDMSSSEPAGTRALGDSLAQHDIILLDAPVSGAVPRAQAGTLAIMIGGQNEPAIAKIEPVMLAMGNKLFRTGPLGSGHAMKALNNFLAASGLAAASEALMIARRFGLDGGTMIDIMNVSTGKNFATEALVKQHMLSGSYSSGFSLGLLAKDVAIAARLADDLGIEAPVAELLARRFAEARDAIGGDRDNSAYVTAWDETLKNGA